MTQPVGPPGHLVLLGDSIFDNAAYVRGGPDVVAQLRTVLPEGWRATLAAVDGAVVRDVRSQLRRIPPDATHLVLSAGGNDALGHVDILQRPARSAAEVLSQLAGMREDFAQEYGELLDTVMARGLPLIACTIYEGSFPDQTLQRLAATALTVFNDAIVRLAVQRRIGLIDLRLVCDAPEHYANPIEPSVRGGERISAAIVDAVLGDGKRTTVTAAPG